MSHHQLLAILGQTTVQEMMREREREEWGVAVADPEADMPWDGILADEDREPPTTVGIFDAIPMPRDPYRELGADAE
jgi:hypothetical protein